ncbi:transcriptional regulator [Haloprofundus halobius]|uniref:transcriptional regulator n=1 Tax=Haloprofundus halobius TaxID=2876194 RepID=UPI001CC92A5E|nr:transcriptional regulator [Haloprofundus halobius]
MADLNPIAKRIHNVSPKPVLLTLSDGSSAVYHFSGTQFFQREFQGEGTCEDDDADYRLVTSEDNESVLLGRKGREADGWSMVGEVTEVERVERTD